MGNVTNIDEHRPHRVFEAICVDCCHRWIAVTHEETTLKELECAGCSRVGTVINTGQEIDDA
jgi:hypothetical protein